MNKNARRQPSPVLLSFHSRLPRRGRYRRRAINRPYWTGSEARGDRRRELRWLPPIPVALELGDGAAPFTTVRPVDKGVKR